MRRPYWARPGNICDTGPRAPRPSGVWTAYGATVRPERLRGCVRFQLVHDAMRRIPATGN